MAYVDVNTPVISQITLPSGNSYYIADREIRDVVQALSETIAGGVNFSIVWGASDFASTTAPTTAKRATIPEGVTVYYNNGASSSTGTLEASATTKGTFYLIYSKTQSGNIDYYDEYATITSGTTYAWEKLGDTIIELANVVIDVTLNKQTTNFVTGLGTPSTDSVIGADATFSITQPTIALATGATAGTGVISVATNASGTSTYLGATASGAGVAWNSKDSVTAVTGVSATKTNVKATASGANVAWNSKDSVTAVTGVSATTSKLVTASVTGVQSSTTTASKATAGTAQTTATGGSTASTTNTDWLKGISVSNGVLTIGAATLNTQSTPQYTFSNVTVPIKATSATTVATGSLSSSGTGDSVATGVSASGTDTVIGTDSTFTVTQPTIALATGATAGTGVVSLATDATASSTDTVIGSDATFTVTQPTVALASNTSSATGRVSVVTGVSATTTNIKATASGANTSWNNKDTVTAVTSIGTPSTAAGLNNSTSITVTKGD